MIFYYGTQISPHMDKTPEGYLICRDVPIARTGSQEYLAQELQLDGDPERVVTVNRHPEDVFEPAALASFEGKDITQGHPPEDVGPENFASYSVIYGALGAVIVLLIWLYFSSITLLLGAELNAMILAKKKSSQRSTDNP